jgi:hypothetical protein
MRHRPHRWGDIGRLAGALDVNRRTLENWRRAEPKRRGRPPIVGKYASSHLEHFFKQYARGGEPTLSPVDHRITIPGDLHRNVTIFRCFGGAAPCHPSTQSFVA